MWFLIINSCTQTKQIELDHGGETSYHCTVSQDISATHPLIEGAGVAQLV
jgi:hypothetical protein